MADLQTRPTHVLEDPSAQAVARVYALAYLDAATSTGTADPLEELNSFYEVFEQQSAFASLLTSETTSREEKLGLIERVVQPRASEFFTNFLKVLARHARLGLLPVIVRLCSNEQEQRQGQQRITVRSASALTEGQLQRIKDRLQAALSIEPILVSEVDEKLIGGLVIQVGDTVYDGSLRTRLQGLKSKLRERYLHEIQSGRDRFGHSTGN